MRRGVVALFAIALTITSSTFAKGSEISNTSSVCSDLVMLFARGSSSNSSHLYTDDPFGERFKEQEQIPGSFFQWMELRLKADYPNIDYKAISIHNSGNMWSANGYPAVGIFNPSTVNNIFDAEFAWWPAGEFRGSVRSGMDELKGQVNYEATRCPNQRIVVGGYSQGANVVGDALFEIPQAQRNLIDNVVLFGDPKFIGADYNKYNLLEKPKAYPWHRGTAGLRERGVNDARIPYVPDDMKYKTISWCHEDDFVCTGLSGVGWGITNHELPSNDNSIWKGPKGALGDGHSRYPVFGVPEATEEVLANLKHHLTTLEIERGGLDPKLDSYRKAYDGTPKNTHPVDIMFALNNTGGIEDAQAQYYQTLKSALDQYKTNFPDMKTGSILYTDMLGGAGANQSSVAAYTQRPNQLSSSNDSMFAWTPYLYGIGGGGDYPENHGMAIERGGMFANWREGARKHLVIFAERPAQDAYSYNMCNSSIVSVLPHSGETPCEEGKTYNTATYPEWCYNVYHTLSGASCPYVGTTASTKVISRTLEDSVLLAQSKGFTVDIIQPHTARDNQPGYSPTYVSDQLKRLAESTGGLYLLYDTQAFGAAQMRDAIWQILNHEPTVMRTSGYVPGSLLDFNSTSIDLSPYAGLARIPTNTPTLLTTTPVSGAQSYGWDIDGDLADDELSQGPVLELVLLASQQKFIRVTAYSGPSGTGPLSSVALPIVLTPQQQNIYIPGVGTGLINPAASRHDNETIVELSWDTGGLGEHDIVVVSDPVSGVPVATVPAQQASYMFDPGAGFGDLVRLQIVRPGAEADPQTVTIETIHTVEPIEDVPIGDNSDPADIQNPTDPSDIPPIEESLPVDDEPGTEVIVVIEVPEVETVVVVDPDPVDDPPQEPQESQAEIQDNVGQTDDKTVTQNEQNSSAQTQPRQVQPAPVAQPASAPRATTQTGAGDQTVPSPTTIVQAAQDVNTNPQSEVGDKKDVKELFPEVGSSPATEGSEGSNEFPWLIIIAGGGAFILLLLLLIFLKKKSSDEEETE